MTTVAAIPDLPVFIYTHLLTIADLAAAIAAPPRHHLCKLIHYH